MNYDNLPFQPLNSPSLSCKLDSPCGPLGFNACAPGSQGALPQAGPMAGACPGSTSFGPIVCAFPPL